ncbi:MAG: hypothetical protein M3O30_03160 [Planctomycetota bacterium]|nr:hypothetical protein [Planctomycetota bacterium]
MKINRPKSTKTQIVKGQPSWRLKCGNIEAFVTRAGGQLGPVVFKSGGKRIDPFSVAPWAGEKLPPATPPIIRVLRGDFFCMPFGSNATRFRGERHPLHGQTANDDWTLESLNSSRGETTLHLSMATTIRQGRVDKTITLKEGQPVVYCRHIVSKMSGPMTFGHHAMLKFPDEAGSGMLSTSRFLHGQVFPGEFENPELGGYSSLRRGAAFSKLARVPRSDGTMADLTRYPARLGFEDLVMLHSDATQPMAWSAVSFPKQRYVWFALKDPRVLRQTILWHSNRGRHYAPWSSRHVGVLGVEDITGYFHYGLAESCKSNPYSTRGYPTCVAFKNGNPVTVNYIMGCIATPPGFDEVRRIQVAPGEKSIKLISAGGKTISAAVDIGFLSGGPRAG